MEQVIVAIDGPSGVGKSTLSKLLAKKLNYLNIDTGAMYRSVALAVQRQGVDPGNQAELNLLIENLDLDFHQTPSGIRVMLNGDDVTEAIRTPDVSLLTPKIAAIAEVRHAMVARQREMGAAGGVVLEGRDIGSVVFPQAQVKLFMTASAEERGRRRYDELKQKGIAVDLQQTISDVEQRDRADRERQHSPLIKTADAIEIDTTGRTVDQVLQSMLAAVLSRQNGTRE